MADLYNLQIDEALEEHESQHKQHETSQDDEIGQEWDREGQDRDRLELPAALEEAEERRKQQGTPEATDERVDLEDVLRQSSAEEDAADLPYSRLKTLWTQELDSPELLPHDEETVRTLTEALKLQEERIEDVQAFGTTGNANLDALTASLLRVDADRVKFVLCSLMRERLRKLEEHPLHYAQERYAERMSDEEADFLRGYNTLVEGHLHRTVLDHFPQDAWKKLDAPEMVDGPDLDTYVFVRVNGVAIDIGGASSDGTGSPDVQLHDKGACLIVRYSRIRDLFLEDKVELLM